MIYNTLAHYYDALVKDEEASREWVSWIESELAPCDCLELACGSGEITEMLVKKGYTMTALDLSEEMVTCWTNFMKTGEPNGETQIQEEKEKWESYTKENPYVKIFK